MSTWQGIRLGRYQIEERVGRGGFGEVYRAVEVGLHRQVAIKILSGPENIDEASRQKLLERFNQEAQVVASLEHPNILPIYSYDQYEGTPYLVMPLMNKSLSQRLRAGPISLEQIVFITTQVTAGLQYAHDQNIVHRDIKPPNIMLNTDESRVVVADFGIARILSSFEEVTQTSVIIGSPLYMAPEQVSGEVSRRSDVYSLGLTVYEMIMGSLPKEHAYKNLPPPSQYRAEVPPGMDAAILKALEKDPDRRFARVDDFGDEMEEALRQMGRAPFRPGRAARSGVSTVALPNNPNTPTQGQPTIVQNTNNYSGPVSKTIAQAADQSAATRISSTDEKKSVPPTYNPASFNPNTPNTPNQPSQYTPNQPGQYTPNQPGAYTPNPAPIMPMGSGYNQLNPAQANGPTHIVSEPNIKPTTKTKDRRPLYFLVGGVAALIVIGIIAGIIAASSGGNKTVEAAATPTVTTLAATASPQIAVTTTASATTVATSLAVTTAPVTTAPVTTVPTLNVTTLPATTAVPTGTPCVAETSFATLGHNVVKIPITDVKDAAANLLTEIPPNTTFWLFISYGGNKEDQTYLIKGLGDSDVKLTAKAGQNLVLYEVKGGLPQPGEYELNYYWQKCGKEIVAGRADGVFRFKIK